MPFPVTDVKDIDDLEEHISKLDPPAAGYQRLYRGQNKDHAGLMIPSLYRGADFFSETDYAWKLAGQKIIKEEIQQSVTNNFGTLNDPSTNFPLEGLVQHYGLRSGGLDLTSDINVALWFARYKQHETFINTEILIDNKKTGIFRFRKAWYDLAVEEYSYIYIFDCPVWVQGNMPKIGDCVDLLQWFGKFTARPVMQKAWYVHADNLDIPRGDLSSFVKMVYKLPNELNREFEQKTSYYFPIPAEDKLYHRLLGSYFMKNDKNFFERTLDIPQYYDTGQELASINDVYVETFRVSSHANFFKAILGMVRANPAHAIMISGNTSYSLLQAELIKMNIPDWSALFADADSNGHTYIPRLQDVVLPGGINYNYFIELSICEFVASKDPSARVMRGVWIVQENSKLGMQLFYFGVNGFSTSDPIWFQKSESDQLAIIEDNKKIYTEVEKTTYLDSILNAMRVIQNFKKIKYLPGYIPLRRVYGDQ